MFLYENSRLHFRVFFFTVSYIFLLSSKNSSLLQKSSFHKKSTRKFLLKLIRDDWGFPESEVVAEMKFDIPQSYGFHKSKSKDIEVDLIRIFVGGKNDNDDNEEVKKDGEIRETDEMIEKDK